MQPQQFAALKRCAHALTGQRVRLARIFIEQLDDIIPGLGRRLEGRPAEDLVSSWIEAARCADRWQNIQPMLQRAADDLQEHGLRSREFDQLEHAWMATLQEVIADRLDGDLHQGWRYLMGRFTDSLRRSTSAPLTGMAASLA